MTSNTYSYQQQTQQQLVPHYGPNFDPYNVNQNRQQQQGPPAFNPSYYYSPTSAQINGNGGGVPAQVSTSPYASEPSMLSSPSEENLVEVTDGNDIPDEIIRSQQMAWKSAQKRNQSQQETALTNYNATANLVVPHSRNPTGSDSVHPHKKQMKQGRKVTTAAAATSGALVGAIVTGPAFPVGAIVGGAMSGYAANKLHKQGERRAQRKWEQSNFQLGTNKAPIQGVESIHTIV